MAKMMDATAGGIQCILAYSGSRCSGDLWVPAPLIVKTGGHRPALQPPPQGRARFTGDRRRLLL